MSPSATKGAIDTPPRAPSPVANFGTLAIHAGSPHDPSTGAVIEAVSSSYDFLSRDRRAESFSFRSLQPLRRQVLGNP